MDRIADSGSADGGSNPSGHTLDFYERSFQSGKGVF